MYPRVGETIGRYTVGELIGRGAMGAVYRAQDPRLGREVAMKVVLPQFADDENFRARFEREATALATVRSRNIVSIYDIGQADGFSFLVTQYFPDGDLRRRIAQKGPLSVTQALGLAGQICEAVADAHAAGIIHRDIKASNILLWNRRETLLCYLGDFGIAGLADSDLTFTGHGIGTLATMAPERHEGHRGDERGDIYSLGCLLYTMLTGDPPFRGTEYQIVRAHMSMPPPRLPRSIPGAADLDELVTSLMAKSPAHRPASAADVAHAISSVGTTTPVPPVRPVRPVTATIAPERSPATYSRSARSPQRPPPVAPQRGQVSDRLASIKPLRADSSRSYSDSKLRPLPPIPASEPDGRVLPAVDRPHLTRWSELDLDPQRESLGPDALKQVLKFVDSQAGRIVIATLTLVLVLVLLAVAS